MSTNAVIRVEGLGGIEAYKHYDGYPSGTLPWLQQFNSTFTRERGDDPAYKMAQLMRSSFAVKEEFDLDPSTTTGWGIDTEGSFLWDYLYILRRDGTVEVQS